MSFDWSEYYKLAEDLATRTSTYVSQDADLRSAISRAYYAAFCKGRNYLLAKGATIPSSGRAHKVVKDKFFRSRNRKRRKIGLNLGRLRYDRGLADYVDTIANLQTLAQGDLLLAEEVLQELNTLP